MIYQVTGKMYRLKIGRAGEHHAKEIEVNIMPWLELWPNGTAAVLIQRPEDEEYYMALNVSQDNDTGILTWLPDATDTAQETNRVALKIQVVFTNGQSVIARAPIWLGRVESSLLDDDTDPPEFQQEWVSQVLEAAGRVYAATAKADAWEQAFNWILEQMDTDYPAVETFLEEVQSLKERTTSLEEQTTELEGRATDLENRATDLENRATDLEDSAADLDDRATDLEGRATSLESRATDLESRATAVENGKIPKPASTVESGKFARSNGEGEVVWQDGIDSSEVSTLVNNWLNSHVVGQAFPLDNTLALANAAADAKKTGELIASQYSTTATYAVGDYVIYNGILYRCNTAIETAEAWTAAHWTAVPLGNEVSDLKSVIDNSENMFISELTPTWTDGFISGDGTIDTSSYYKVCLFPLPNINKIHIKNMYVGNGSATIAFYSGTPATTPGKVISFVKNDRSTTFFDVPSNATHAAVAKIGTEDTDIFFCKYIDSESILNDCEKIGYYVKKQIGTWVGKRITADGIIESSDFYAIAVFPIANEKKIELNNQINTSGAGTIAFYNSNIQSSSTLISLYRNDERNTVYDIPTGTKSVAIGGVQSSDKPDIYFYYEYDAPKETQWTAFPELRWGAGRIDTSGEYADPGSTWYKLCEPIFVKGIKKIKIDNIYPGNSTVSTVAFYNSLFDTSHVVQLIVQPDANIFEVPQNATTMYVTSSSQLYENTVIYYSDDSDFDLRYSYTWPNELRDTLLKVQNLEDTADAFSVVFATDLHYSPKGRNMNDHLLNDRLDRLFSAMKELCTEYPIYSVVCGGDYQQLNNINHETNPQTKQDGIDNLYQLNRWLYPINIKKMVICGNHEDNYTGDGTGYGLDADEIYNYVSKKYITGFVRVASEDVFYEIDDNLGICFVYINTPDQVTYPQTEINGIDVVSDKNVNHYPIVVFNHYGCDHSSTVIYQPVKDAIDRFVSNGDTVLCWISGHCHSDWAATYNGALIISCLQSGALTPMQSYDGTTYEHVNCTETESAFTVITIRKSEGKVNCTRYGLGNDRSFNL